MAPIAPFFADWLFKSEQGFQRFAQESVHHTDFPVYPDAAIDDGLEKRMQLLGHFFTDPFSP